MALSRGSIVLHRLIKGNVKNLQVSDSGPLRPSCFLQGSIYYVISIIVIRFLIKLQGHQSSRKRRIRHIFSSPEPKAHW